MKFIASFLLPSALLLAQVPGAPADTKAMPMSKVERMGKAPVSTEVLRVKLPKPIESKLPNGITVMILENHKVPTVDVRLTILGAGSLYDPSGEIGLASMTAQMLRNGTKSRTSKQLAEDTDKLGATVVASAGPESATISASGLSDNFPQWMALAADVLLNPTFPGDEWAKLKQRQKAQLQQMRAIPGFMVQQQFYRAVYGNHPAANLVPTLAALDSITPEMMMQFYKERYVPQNAILAIAGDVQPAQVIGLLGAMPPWEKTDFIAQPIAAAKSIGEKKVYLINRPNSVQTNLFLGNIALNRTDPDYVPLYVMNQIVGGGAAGRLFLNLREEKGYTYGAYSGMSAQKFAGPWFARADVRSEVTSGSLTEFFNEFNRIRDQQVPAKELTDSKNALVARFALSLEQPSELLNYAVQRKIYDLPADYWDTYPAKIMAVTAEDIQRVARKYVNPETIQIVAVGDATKIKPDLEKYGQVDVITP